MMITRVTAKKTLVAVAVMASLLSGSLATADQVDDLLAGKPVKIEPANADKVAGETDPAVAVSDRVVVPVEAKTLADESWELTVAEPSHTNLEEAGAPRPFGPAATISVVPEPSAIALAALSLVYFLLFFRRRYAF